MAELRLDGDNKWYMAKFYWQLRNGRNSNWKTGVYSASFSMTTEKAKRLKSIYFRAVQMGPCHFDFWEYLQIHFFQRTQLT